MQKVVGSSPIIRSHEVTLKFAILIGCVAVALMVAPTALARDDTAWLQAQLDAGAAVFIPKLPGGECYATRGLWVSRDGTSVTSDGACIIALGAGEARMRSGDGRPVRATAVFFLNHSNVRTPLPVRISIDGLRIRVPLSAQVSGVAVYGHEVTLSNLTIGGSPTTDIVVGAGLKGSGGMTARIEVRNCDLSGARRDAVSVFGPIGLRVEGSTLHGARGAGLRVRAADRGQPTLDVHVDQNRMLDNAGPGMEFDLDPKNGPAVFASGIELKGNEVLRNGSGIVLAGGQSDGRGSLSLSGNVVRGNRGPGSLGRNLRLVVHASGNDLTGNRGGPAKGLQAVAPTHAAPSDMWVPHITSS